MPLGPRGIFPMVGKQNKCASQNPPNCSWLYITTDYIMQQRSGTQAQKKIIKSPYVRCNYFCHQKTNKFSLKVKFITLSFSPNYKFKN